MKLERIKSIASKLLGCGETKLWLNPKELDRVREAMTTEDIRALIKDGIIKKKKVQLHSKGRARILQDKKRRGRKRGFGKRTGSRKARMQRKQSWMKNVRAQRRHLRELKEKKKIGKEMYSKLYALIKGGYFKGRKRIDAFIAEAKK